MKNYTFIFSLLSLLFIESGCKTYPSKNLVQKNADDEPLRQDIDSMLVNEKHSPDTFRLTNEYAELVWQAVNKKLADKKNFSDTSFLSNEEVKFISKTVNKKLADEKNYSDTFRLSNEDVKFLWQAVNMQLAVEKHFADTIRLSNKDEDFVRQAINKKLADEKLFADTIYLGSKFIDLYKIRRGHSITKTINVLKLKKEVWDLIILLFNGKDFIVKDYKRNNFPLNKNLIYYEIQSHEKTILVGLNKQKKISYIDRITYNLPKDVPISE